MYSRSNENEACGWWRAVIKVRLPFNLRIPTNYNSFHFADDEGRLLCGGIPRLGQQLHGDRFGRSAASEEYQLADQRKDLLPIRDRSAGGHPGVVSIIIGIVPPTPHVFLISIILNCLQCFVEQCQNRRRASGVSEGDRCRRV